MESQYELTDRISFYLCERRPDHAAGQHFLIPEMADSIDGSCQLARAAKRRLQMVTTPLPASSYVYFFLFLFLSI